MKKYVNVQRNGKAGPFHSSNFWASTQSKFWILLLAALFLSLCGNVMAGSPYRSTSEYCPCIDNGYEFVAFPNPASSKLYIQCQAQKGDRIVLTNAVGMEAKQTNLTEGLNQISLDISTLLNGLYICHIVQDGRSIHSEKVVVFNH